MITSKNKIMDWLTTAKKAALLAGAFLKKRKQSSVKVNAESVHDVKIAADLEAEDIILDYLKKRSNFSILSEENGLFVGKRRQYTWIVDPLDGSLNYLRGIPLSCVSIGLWQGESPVLGVVYEFNRSELFSGIVGKGAWLNNRPLKVSATAQKQKAVLCTGFPVNTDFSPGNIRAFAEDIRSYKKIRLLGSAAISIAYVASGRADAYHEKDIMFWDVAGGIPILLGAGGKLNMKKASKPDSYHIYASNGRL